MADGVMISQNPFNIHCPNCGEVYLQGNAAILFQVSGHRFYLGQGQEEAHTCPYCQQEIRGGNRNGRALVRVFPSAEMAQAVIRELAISFQTDPNTLKRTIVLVRASAMQIVRLQ
jgi:uncharacterized Zn-finger protein